MNISLTPEIDAWVAEKVRSGMYKSSSEVIREGLRLLHEREVQRQAMVEDLRHELLVGVRQLDVGNATPFDTDQLARIKQDARKRFGS
ncbi:MAG: type II toxin-antitoxin system ParD family antitoxin [Geopsychrobacter sp.]|nr:type II toxin-antitoxin system ParD family antitoxin [Geopsychrobacter sp.]